MSKLQPYGRGRASCKRDIQRVLDAQGRNYTDVASLAGVTIQTVSATMNGYCHSPKVLDGDRQISTCIRIIQARCAAEGIVSPSGDTIRRW